MQSQLVLRVVRYSVLWLVSVVVLSLTVLIPPMPDANHMNACALNFSSLVAILTSNNQQIYQNAAGVPLEQWNATTTWIPLRLVSGSS